VRKSAVRPVLLAVHIFTPWSEMSAYHGNRSTRREPEPGVIEAETPGEPLRRPVKISVHRYLGVSSIEPNDGDGQLGRGEQEYGTANHANTQTQANASQSQTMRLDGRFTSASSASLCVFRVICGSICFLTAISRRAGIQLIKDTP
jgi:hypothetical protein